MAGWTCVDLHTGQPHPASGLAWPDDIGVEVGQWMRDNGFAAYASRWPTLSGVVGPAVTAPAVAGDPEGAGEASDPSAVSEVSGSSLLTDGRPAVMEHGRVGQVNQSSDDAGWLDLARHKAGQAALQAAKDRSSGWTRLGRLLGFRTPDLSWRIGARGERLVGRTLWWATLFGWRAIHAVPIGTRGADIDHLLIGPGGVLTVNTKHHRGGTVKAGRHVIFVRGRQTRYAEKARAEARQTSERLSMAYGQPVEVAPLIVVVGALGVHGRRTQGVRVLTRPGLLWHLLFRGRRLDRDQRNALYEIARRSTTWTQPRRRREAP